VILYKAVYRGFEEDCKFKSMTGSYFAKERFTSTSERSDDSDFDGFAISFK
jgi:hypothetical protein